MPQEHHVLKCFSCETFQVHIVKKVNKWECKVCGAKQSLKRNYGKGTARDCRTHVMKLNELRLTMGNSSGQTEGEIFEDSTNYFEEDDVKEVPKAKKVFVSKWDKYLEDNTNDKSEEEDDVQDFFLETENTKKRVKKLTEEYHPKPKKVCLETSRSEILSESFKDTIPLAPCSEKKFYNSEKSPIKMKAKLQKSKYAKYVDEEEGKDEFINEDKYLNVFDSEPTDLDTILNFE